ncbi:MAG: sulfatase-like hydrolase/transferase [Akkermansia sp.]|nr:sulfatase-like hydrolase/transferase [Akkermansia sp.]
MNTTSLKKSSIYWYFISIGVVLIVSSIWTISSYWSEWVYWWFGLKNLIATAFIFSVGGLLLYKTRMRHLSWQLPISTWIPICLFSVLTSSLCIEFHQHLPQVLVIATGSLAFTLLLYTIAGRFSLIFWSTFLFLEIVQLASFYRLGVRISGGIIAEMMHASQAEIKSFATTENLMGLALAFLSAVGLSWWQHRTLRRFSRFVIAGHGCFFMALFCILLAFVPHHQRLCPKHLQYLQIYPYPIQETYHILKESSEEANQDVKLLLHIQNMPSPAELPSRSTVTPDNAGIVCILHIGESVRSDRLKFNGYHRNTTPWLSSQKNLISYPRCISLYHQTTTCIVGILTDGARKEAHRETFSLVSPGIGNIADLFSKHGYYTVLFAGYDAIYQKSIMTRYTFGDAMLALNKKTDCIQESKGSPMQQAQQVVDLCNAHANRNMFIVLNNEGSHGPFNMYDLEHPTFTPSNPEDFFTSPHQDKEGINNAYDNTLVYTDACIKKIAEGLKGRPFIYIYVSDHGEYLGQNGKWGRTWIFAQHNPQEGIRAFRHTDAASVGMFYLPSDEWLALHPHFNKAAEQLRKNRLMTISHGHIFDTLLGIFGIETPHYKATWDCSSPLVEPYTGTQPDLPQDTADAQGKK